MCVGGYIQKIRFTQPDKKSSRCLFAVFFFLDDSLFFLRRRARFVLFCWRLYPTLSGAFRNDAFSVHLNVLMMRSPLGISPVCM